MTAAKKTAQETVTKAAKAPKTAPQKTTDKAPKAPAKTKETAPKAAPKKAVKAPKAKAPAGKKGVPVAHGVGRRKAAVARVWLRKNGQGIITVNNRTFDEYFDTIVAQKAAKEPMHVLPLALEYDVQANVTGGGLHGQADAIKLAISRALVAIDQESKAILKQHGLLTVDSRVVERKKPGQRGARRKFQFVKR